jgi:lipopolysaccharide export system protein LptC
MGERLTAWVPLFLVGMLAALTFWLDRVVQPAGRDLGKALRHDPDYIVDKLSAVRMSKAGSASYTLVAEKMVHYPDDDTTLLTAPRFVSYGAAKAPVTVTANQALVSADGKDVYFQDDVHVRRAAYDDNSEMALRTTFLHVIPDQHLAKTDRPVTITDAATVVNAVGLEWNSETRIVNLLSSVRGTYDPGKAPQRDGKR